MRVHATLPLFFCLLAVPVRGGDVAEVMEPRRAALNAWETEYDALAGRLPRDGALRAALERAGTDRGAMRSLLGKAEEHASAFSSAKFKSDFLGREWESARREAERISAAKDARYEELMSGARSTRENKLVDLRARTVTIEEWRTRVNAQGDQAAAFAKQIEPLMRTYTLPDEQAAYDHAKGLQAQRDAMYAAYTAENNRLNAAINARNADSQGIEDEWTRRLAEIEAFMREDGRRTLEATQLASKKEREFREAEAKFSTIMEELQATLGDLDGRFQAAAGALRAVAELEAIRLSAAGAAPDGGSTAPYATRSSAEAAQAVAPPPAPAGRSGGVRARVFVLPSAAPNAGTGEAEAEARRQSAAMAAEILAAQFRPAADVAVAVTDVPAAPAGPAPGEPRPAAAPAVFLGPAPVGGGGVEWDSASVVVLDDDALTRAFHPGIFVSDAEYRRAVAARDRNAALIPKLEEQLARMRDQRDGLAGDRREFDALRREIAIGATREVVGLYATRLDMLLKNTRFAATLSAAQKGRLEAAKRAFDTLKLGLVMPHAGEAGSRRDADNLRREAWEEGSAALAELAGSQVGGEWAGKFFAQGGNLLKAGGKLDRHLRDPDLGRRPWSEEVGQNVKTSIEMVGTWCPPIALGIGLEAVGERGLQWAITQDAVDSLSTGVKSTDDAIVFLADRLRRAQELNDQAQQVIDKRNGASPARRRGFGGGS